MSDTAVQTADRAAVLDVLNSVYTAWAANDADAFVADYDPDVTSVLPGVYSNGRDAVRARMAAAFQGPLRGSRVLNQPELVRFPVPDAAVVISRDAILMAGESEPPADRWVRANWTVIRRDGRWLLTAFHAAPA
ncbi:SgcJ/EcaC family oxidoreductase [Nocardia seriolae]|uniref:SgcJ/EcaC family oxidoreductase n=1 Tax=Nocardia seriolae TaxID=37332 RepID=UPI00051A05B6|nr:SgcJ/EcaC family oxidoreductase [Nocardia seriolae]MTJ62754.1 SgcJ/EcaC family oxidoreductase [Nocardia seriolae]MTJ75151.1 SgcJ/EcaC family oxidoreductase [Nocardia seriolae]MTJ87789.1 SgcJ/EcaC family oxidoreductase [Nocardia seriolae]MTK31782.1 SgcJ/EcaC family oxidoreductase [Nocardia seriolae]MTK40689.1 SgcJ/EcaC family oxidoreductase [Nocardia seriolae]